MLGMQQAGPQRGDVSEGETVKCIVCGRVAKNSLTVKRVDIGDGKQAVLCSECARDRMRVAEAARRVK